METQSPLGRSNHDGFFVAFGRLLRNSTGFGLLAVLCAFPVPAGAVQTSAGPAPEQKRTFTDRIVPEQIAVKLKPTAQLLQVADPKDRKAKEADTFRELERKFAVRELKPAFRAARIEPCGAKKQPLGPRRVVDKDVKSRDELKQWYRVTLGPGQDVAEAVKAFKGHPDVLVAEPVYEYRTQQVIPPPITGLPDGTTDPLIPGQWFLTGANVQQGWWYLKNQGRQPGGTNDVITAVIDTGVDYTHQDLAGNMWVNSGEIPGNGIDDDADGFVDDIYGVSVVSAPISHSGNPMDFAGHGTHVAGIIAASAFNNVGGAGVAFNTRIMAVAAGQYSGVFTTTDISEGILYAFDHGAEVINMSFGGYQRSQIVVDALAVALSQAVLVAAAGNDGVMAPLYPASLHFVLGVMAADPSLARAWFSNYGPWCDVLAPGEGILSTLPGNQYAAWSGTSMATPVVSGVAALMRSYFTERDIYSSRFIMGSIAQNGSPLNTYKVLTEPPKPGVSMLSAWLFDDKSISASNDADGRADSGETLHIAIEAINRSGQADNVFAWIEANNGLGVGDDPYVTITTPLVQFGNIGPFNTADNGLIYGPGGVITGVSDPFVFTVDINCPNDHVIPFIIHWVWNDGWNPSDPTFYESQDTFTFTVQRGKNIPTVIAENTTLGAADYWIVGGPVLIEPAATVTVEPGTYIQWGAISSDPFNPGPQPGSVIVRGKLLMQGTQEDPINLFPSTLVAGQTVNISAESGSTLDMAYVKVRNPLISGATTIDHSYFDWENYGSQIKTEYISNSIFHGLRGGGEIRAGMFETCLFDAGWLPPTFNDWGFPVNTPDGPEKFPKRLRNSVLLQDNENNVILSPFVADAYYKWPMKTTSDDGSQWFYNPASYNGSTYVLLPMEYTNIRLAELVANFYGGHVTSVRDADEQAFLESYIDGLPNPRFGGWSGQSLYYIGLTDDGHPGDYQWLDGSPLTYTNWNTGFPVTLSLAQTHVTRLCVIGPTACPGQQWQNQNQRSSYIGWYSYVKWDAFILRIPGAITLEELHAPVTDGRMLSHIRNNLVGYVERNAFLNRYWDPVLSHWYRVQGTPSMPLYYSQMRDNYWGTATSQLIDYMIVDYYDNFTSSRVDYKVQPANGFESTFPFVDHVVLNGTDMILVPHVNSGWAVFEITFNRDMDTAERPFATFGPSSPFTDYVLDPLPGEGEGWVNARTWRGRIYITPVVGDGYHMMRISGAKAASDPWLVSGYDVGRFRFLVATMTAEAMNLQASGGEGFIHLIWQQDDYDLLAGYNLYRSTSQNGTYTRLNTTIIPVGHEYYHDTNVTPGVRMYYKFTIITTDLTESSFSNVASAVPVDTVPPQLIHVPIVSAPPARSLRITADATDNVGVVSVKLFWRAIGTTPYTEVSMGKSTGTQWVTNLLASVVIPPGLEYYIVASDGYSQVFSGTPGVPHVIVVSNVPTVTSVAPNHGPASGGTLVTVAGTLFQVGATVLFGSAPATDVTVVTETQISCRTPAHFPAQVDVKVLNPDASSGILLNGFRFEADGVVLSLPSTTGDYGTMVEVPLSVSNVTGMGAADVTITFTSSVVAARSARVGALTAGWALSTNVATPGSIRLSMANASTVTGTGEIAVITFEVVGAPPASTPLTITSASLNSGAIIATLSHGTFTVNGFYSLSGTVTHDSSVTVPGVVLSLTGNAAVTQTTGTNGTFQFTDVRTGNYILTPSKSDDVEGISSYDASRILEHAAGITTLTGHAAMAADVNRNGLIDSMDAFYVLQMAASLIDVPFPGAGSVWMFDPATRNYPNLSAHQTGQNFVAILVGDVSGNWTPPEGPGAPTDDGQTPAAVVLPAVSSGLGETQMVSLHVTPGTRPFKSADIVITYDPAVTTPVTAQKGPVLPADWALVANLATPGTIRLAMAGTSAVTAPGTAVEIAFRAIGCSGTTSSLTLQKQQLDEGLTLSTGTNGRFDVVATSPAASNSGPYCVGGTISLSVPTVTGASYAWTGPDGFTSAVQNPTIVNAALAAAGTYAVTMTVNGCVSPSGSTQVVVTPPPSAVITTPESVCAESTGNSASVPDAGTGATYSWSITNGTITAGASTRTILFTAGASGSVELTATVEKGPGCSSTETSILPVTSGTPVIETFNPGSGQAGASVTLSGTNFHCITGVSFNGVAALFNVSSSTSFVAIVPAGATTGPIAVTNRFGTGSSPINFIVIRPGDVNADGSVDVADVFYLINYLFAGGPSPLGLANANGDAGVDVADVFYLINYLFAGGPAPM